MDGQNSGPREPIWRTRRWQVPLRSWVGLLALVFALNVLFAFCGAGAQSVIPFSDFVTQSKRTTSRAPNFSAAR
jgi:hypothetical protein